MNGTIADAEPGFSIWLEMCSIQSARNGFCCGSSSSPGSSGDGLISCGITNMPFVSRVTAVDRTASVSSSSSSQMSCTARIGESARSDQRGCGAHNR